MLPPPGESCESRSTASARIAPIAMDDERVEEGSRVELAGLVRDVGLNGRRGICMGRAPDGERCLIALPRGRRVNVKMSNIKPSGDLDTEIVQREDTSAVPLSAKQGHDRGSQPDSLAQCEICVQARGKSDWHTQVKYDSEIPCVQMDFQFIYGVAVWCPEAQAKATVLTMVDMDSGYVGVLSRRNGTFENQKKNVFRNWLAQKNVNRLSVPSVFIPHCVCNGLNSRKHSAQHVSMIEKVSAGFIGAHAPIMQHCMTHKEPKLSWTAFFVKNHGKVDKLHIHGFLLKFLNFAIFNSHRCTILHNTTCEQRKHCVLRRRWKSAVAKKKIVNLKCVAKFRGLRL